MGHRTRRVGEYLIIMQKPPTLTEGAWQSDNIPDVVIEQVERIGNGHPKPVNLRARLIEAVTDPRQRGVRPDGRQLFRDDRRPPGRTPIPRLRHRKRIVTGQKGKIAERGPEGGWVHITRSATGCPGIPNVAHLARVE